MGVEAEQTEQIRETQARARSVPGGLGEGQQQGLQALGPEAALEATSAASGICGRVPTTQTCMCVHVHASAVSEQSL